MFSLGQIGKLGAAGSLTLAQRYRSVLRKYSTSHLWDFGVAQGPLAYAASHTAAEFISAFPGWPLWQDAAGTVPACKINDSIGLCLDQPTGVVTLGPELVMNGGFDSATGWTKGTGWSIAGGVAVATACSSGIYAPFVLTIGKTYQCRVDITLVSGSCIYCYDGSGGTVVIAYSTGAYIHTFVATKVTLYAAFGQAFTGTIDNISVREVIGAHASQATPTKRPILSGRVNLLTATTTLSTQSITTLAASYKLTFTGSGTVTLSGTYSGSLVSGGSLTFTATPGTLTLTVTGSVTLADLRPANSPTNIPAYQRVTSATDYDTVGFPVRALFDGVDDCLVVPSLDLSMTDKVTVVAGVTKLSDAADGCIFGFGSLSGGGVGTLDLSAPGLGTATKMQFASRGTTTVVPYTASSAYNAPLSAVATAVSKISAPSALLRINGATVATVATTQGSGNYGSWPLYIGQRTGTTTPFNGAIQSLAVIGNLLPDGEVQILEASANAAMGKVY